MTVPAKYTLTEAHLKIVELEQELAAAKEKYDKLVREIEDQDAEPAEFVI